MIYRKQLESAVRAVNIDSPLKYSFLGQDNRPINARLKKKLSDTAVIDYLTYSLSHDLYSGFYCLGGIAGNKGQASISDRGTTESYLADLSKCNSGKGHWQNGWNLTGIDESGYYIERDGLSIVVALHELQDTSDEDKGLKISDVVSVRHPKELLRASPGFYVAFSDHVTEKQEGPIFRVYWHLARSGAPKFVKISTQVLNQNKISFRLKVLNDPTEFDRCDSAVMYFYRSDYDLIAPLLIEIQIQLKAHLIDTVPALTKCIAPGVAIAESPESGESFGLSRCRYIAEGLVDAWLAGVKSLETKLEHIEHSLRSQNIQLQQPYLLADSEDIYQAMICNTNTIEYLPRITPSTSGSEIASEKCLDAAKTIALDLCEQAIWHDGSCNWLGNVPGSVDDDISDDVTGTLGPDLYGGTTGIALFLALMFQTTKMLEFKQTAIAAVRHAQLTHKELVVPSVGFYIGQPGVAWAFNQIGLALNHASIINSGTEILTSFRPVFGHDCEMDLLSGCAGAICAYLGVFDSTSDNELLERAIRFGENLISCADKDSDTMSWALLHSKNRRNLTGFSHGVAGIGYALSKLANISGQKRFSDAAESAFAYERLNYNTEHQNWPDFRQFPGQAKGAESFQSVWCHGSAGIALSRLHAYLNTDNSVFKEELQIALSDTRKTLHRWLDSSSANFSLCHGMAGNAMILNYADKMQGKNEHNDLVISTAEKGLAQLEKDQGWNLGAITYSPSLMVGTAGIGLFYLQLSGETVPPVLMPS